MTDDALNDRTGSRPSAALLGGALVLGWSLHDVVTFALHGEPSVLLVLAPGWLVAIALGAAAGAVLGRSRVALGLLLAAAVAGVLVPHYRALPLSRPQLLLPWAVLLLGGGFGVLRFALARAGSAPLGSLRAGVAWGLVACAASTLGRLGAYHPQAKWLLGLGLVLAAAGFLHGRARALVTLALVLGALGVTWWRALEGAQPSRPDLEPPTAEAHGPNLLLIVLDTVRADRLSAYGYERETTPALDAFARDEATLYTQARSTSPYTLPSHASLFTGLLPSEHGARNYGTRPGALRDDVPTLAEELRARGYRTGAVVSNATYVSPTFGLDRGFEHFDDRRGSFVLGYDALPQMARWRLRVGHLAYRDARRITDDALAWLAATAGRARSAPFFLFVNYLDAHRPTMPPEATRHAFEERLPVEPLRPEEAFWGLQYDRELLGLDAQVGRLLAGLRERRLLDDTAVVITSDHGEALGDHGFPEHSWTLFEPVVHVPLLVKPAGGRTRATDETPLSGADVHGLMRALLEEAELAQPDASRPFGEWIPHDPVQPRWLAWAAEHDKDLERDLIGWIQDGRKVVVDSKGRVEVYDLSADPGELSPLDVDEAERAAAVRRAREYWAREARRAQEAGVIDDATRKRFEALGYAGEG